jgi:glycosyltransferase involved in cell wall biosynthesis
LRILFFCPQPLWPTNTGARLRNFHLAKELGRQFSVTVLQLTPPGEPIPDAHNSDLFEKVITVPRERGYTPGRIVRGIVGPLPIPVLNYFAPRAFTTFSELLETRSFDAVQLESVHLFMYLSAIRATRKTPKLLVDWHNIESELMKRYAEQTKNLARKAVAFRTAQLLARTERKLLQQAAGHTVVSEREKLALLKLAPGAKVQVIANGVDTNAFECAASVRTGNDRRLNLLFVGSMDYHANIDAVTWFVLGPWTEIARRFPSMHFVIAGRQPAPEVQALASDRVHVTGTVSDLAKVYSEAFAVLVPLRVGGGTRLKILEAMAAGVPVISTRLGAEGLNAREGAHLLIADTGDQMGSSIAALLESTEVRVNLIRSGRQLVEQEYDWGMLGQRLARFYTDVVFASGVVSPAAAK